MFLIAVALSAAAPPERWVHLGGSPDLYEEYLDKESVRRSGDKVTVWTRRDFARGRTTAWNELELDCSRRTETILAWIRDENGTVSHNVERPHRAAAPIEAGSVAERIFEKTCR